MEKIHAIIVDDEKLSRENLSNLIKIYCPELEIVGVAESASRAKELINNLEPDVLFLDINMPNGNGFDLLDSIPDYDFSVVFATAHNEYGIQAVKADAVDYLLKPIDILELQKTVKKLVQKFNSKIIVPPGKETSKEKPQKIIINHFQGFSILTIVDLIHLEANNNYTKIYLINQPPIISSKNLKELEYILDRKSFFRTHKSHIVNFRYVREYSNLDGGFITMSDNSKILISRRRHQEFLEAVHQFTLFI